jgi:hypothetical protein
MYLCSLSHENEFESGVPGGLRPSHVVVRSFRVRRWRRKVREPYRIAMRPRVARAYNYRP